MDISEGLCLCEWGLKYGLTCHSTFRYLDGRWFLFPIKTIRDNQWELGDIDLTSPGTPKANSHEAGSRRHIEAHGRGHGGAPPQAGSSSDVFKWRQLDKYHWEWQAERYELVKFGELFQLIHQLKSRRNHQIHSHGTGYKLSILQIVTFLE